MQELSGKPPSKEAVEGRQLAKEELQALYDQLKSGKGDYYNITKLLFYSPKFRDLVFELVGILQDATQEVRWERGQKKGVKEEEAGEQKVPEKKEGVKGELERLGEEIKGKAKSETEKTKVAGKEAEKVGKAPTTSRAPILSEEAMSKLSDRFVDWLRKVHETPETIQAFDFINERTSNLEGLELFNIAFKEKSDLKGDELKLYEAAQQSDAVRVGIGAKVFAEHWIGCSLDPFFNSLAGLRSSLMKDEDARSSLTEFNQFLRKCLKEPGYIEDSHRRKEEFKSHVQTIRSKFSDKYRSEADHLMQEASTVIERARKDELSVKLTSDIQDLFNHLFKDEAGNLTVKPELWNDVKTILPVFFGRLRFIKLPELVVRDESVDFRATGITISVGELAPKRVQAHFYSDLDVAETDLVEAVGEEYDLQSLFVVEVGKIYAEARNVYFEMDRKAFPPLTDAGIADLNVHGDDGMSLRLIYGARRAGRVATETVTPIGTGFHLLKAKCTIDKLDLRLHETRHSWMYTVLGPLIRRNLKQRIEQEIEKFLMSGEWMEGVTNPETIVEALQSAATQ